MIRGTDGQCTRYPLQELAMNFTFQAPHARLSRVRQFDPSLLKWETDDRGTMEFYGNLEVYKIRISSQGLQLGLQLRLKATDYNSLTVKDLKVNSGWNVTSKLLVRNETTGEGKHGLIHSGTARNTIDRNS